MRMSGLSRVYCRDYFCHFYVHIYMTFKKIISIFYLHFYRHKHRTPNGINNPTIIKCQLSCGLKNGIKMHHYYNKYTSISMCKILQKQILYMLLNHPDARNCFVNDKSIVYSATNVSIRNSDCGFGPSFTRGCCCGCWCESDSWLGLLAGTL